MKKSLLTLAQKATTILRACTFTCLAAGALAGATTMAQAQTSADPARANATMSARNAKAGTQTPAAQAQAKASAATLPAGAAGGVFRVSETGRVYFSQGNLQFITTGKHRCADGTEQIGTWRFAEKQYGFAGNSADVGPACTEWFGTFAWGTSGRNSGAEFTNRGRRITTLTRSLSRTPCRRRLPWILSPTALLTLRYGNISR